MPTLDVTCATRSAADPTRVWQLLSHPGDYKTWLKASLERVIEATQQTPGAMTCGSRLRVRWKKSLVLMDLDAEVVVFDPLRAIGLRLEGPGLKGGDVSLGFALEPDESGTKVRGTQRIVLPEGPSSLAVSLTVLGMRWCARRQLRSYCRNLCAAAEAARPAGA